MIEFWKYAKIKDNYCVCYFGYSDEYLVQLNLLRPIIEARFPGLRMCFGCKDDKTYLLSGTDIVKISDLKTKRPEFAHVRELRYNGFVHPIEAFLEESGIRECALRSQPPNEPETYRAVILTSGAYPTKNLERDQVEVLRRRAIEANFEVEIDAPIDHAGIVMGVESIGLFLAAAQGIKTLLVPTGVGTQLYSKMFPFSEVLHT